ncbi:MAG: xanthine dehydrogenase family protein molybdopterin-binding subunit [Acidithiobacillales bacterium]
MPDPVNDARKTTIRIGLPGQTVEKVVEIPAGDPPPLEEGRPRRVFGGRGPRLDGRFKTTGKAVFTHDVRREGLLYGRVLRSPHAHARIVSIDTSKLAAMPGVVFFTPDKKVVRYQGEAVLALAAPSPEGADDALRAVAVAYDLLPHVVTLEEAMADGAPLVFQKTVEEHRTAGDAPGGEGAVPQKGNVRGPRASGRGEKDLSKLFAEADGVVELTVRTQVQTHACLETHSLFAEWKGDELFVAASTQGVFSVRDELAQVFGILKDKVHVTAEYVGGGFGSKFGPGDYGVFAARLAKKAGQPVKLVLDRKEDQLAAGNRPDSSNRMKAAYRKDGTVTAFEYVCHGTAGVGTGAGTGAVVKNSYAFPNVKVEEYDVFTNLGPGCAMRAPGHPQGTLAVEAVLDEIAGRLGMDPLAVRLANDPVDVRRAEWERGAKEIGWDRRTALTSKNREAAARGLPLRRGLGCAASVWYNIVHTGVQVLVRINRDGSVEVENGVQEIGCGNPTTIAVTVAEELGLAPEAVRVKWGSSGYPFGPASGGSTTTVSLIPAVRAAAWHAAEKLKSVAAPLLGASKAEDVTVGVGTFGAAGKSVPWKSVCAKLPGEVLVATGDRAKDYDGTDPRIFGVQFAEVVVDVETGNVRVEKVVAVHDCGLPVWRTGVESQIRGGILQGISYALFEERYIDRRTGRVLNPNLEYYKIIGSVDVPEVVPIVIDLYAGRNNTQTRGVGEPGTIPTCAAVVGAVSHALGVRITEIPVTPARVLAAVASTGKGVTA